jgi:hypothetical protein
MVTVSERFAARVNLTAASRSTASFPPSGEYGREDIYAPGDQVPLVLDGHEVCRIAAAGVVG